ncbi:MAG: hypothetical protein H0V82_07730 [Candidatus Protochlamydia sp.]|nr:hypothetical protein [Candidatus Protochlamydia sp.]
MNMGLEVAEMGDLKYFLHKDPSTNQFEVAVIDKKGNKSTFNFESCNVIDGNLSLDHRWLAQHMIKDFHEEFLEYWNQVKKNEDYTQ